MSTAICTPLSGTGTGSGAGAPGPGSAPAAGLGGRRLVAPLRRQVDLAYEGVVGVWGEEYAQRVLAAILRNPWGELPDWLLRAAATPDERAVVEKLRNAVKVLWKAERGL